jgi:uncharacterized delta-60 repeat protein
VAVAVQPGGKIVAAGAVWSFADDGDFALARYNPDGSLDSTFGGNGKVVADVGRTDFIVRVLVGPRGTVVAAGGSGSDSDTAAFSVLARYGANGTLDTAFGRKGLVTTRLRSLPSGAARTRGGNIVVLAPRRADPKVTTNPPIDIVLVRYQANGRLDPRFGGDGIVVRRARPHSEPPPALAVEKDGAVLVGTHGHPVGTDSGTSFMLVRFRTNGSLDRTFGENGVAVSDVAYSVRALAVDATGRIVAAGASQDLRDFVVTRLTSRGRPDPGFGAVTTDFGAYETPWAVAILPDGAVVAAGQTGRSLGVDTDFALARYR